MVVVLATVGVVPRQLCDPVIKVSALSKWSKTHLFFRGGRGWWWSRRSLVNLQEVHAGLYRGKGTSQQRRAQAADGFKRLQTSYQ